jgi:hypothetical protein
MPSPLVNSPSYVPGLGDGLPGHYTLPGDPNIAIPAGLEAVYEYRGLLMNVQKNVDYYRLTSIDGFMDADIRDTRDVNTSADGETPFNSFYGGRTITISGTIITGSVPKIRAMQYALRAAFADITTEYPLHVRTGNFVYDHIIYCKKIGSIAGVEQQQNQNASRDFQLSLRASNPRFLSYYQNFIEWYLPTPPPTSLEQIGTASNRGNYLAQPIFRIFGPTTGCTFQNAITGDSFTIAQPVAYGDYVDFNMAYPPSLTNSLDQNRWDLLDDDSQLITLLPGDTPILYMGDAPNVQVSWRDSWI